VAFAVNALSRLTGLAGRCTVIFVKTSLATTVRPYFDILFIMTPHAGYVALEASEGLVSDK
jgi:hypothetical protein